MLNATRPVSRSEAENANHEDAFNMEQHSVRKKITYEQPLNERVRNWLRLEYLFSCVMYRMKSPSPWDSRAVMAGLIDILEFIGRTEIKADLIKDLERHAQELERWKEMPGVDEGRLEQLLGRLRALLDEFAALEGHLGQRLAQVPLVSMVRQRSTIPGGTCSFDMPAYYYWLQRNPKQRQADITEWLTLLGPLREAVELNLYLIRNNATASQEIAVSGFFQAKLDTRTPYQIVRVSLPVEYSCFPEISGGRHRFTVRFFEYENVQAQPVATEQDIGFELCCCAA